MRSIRSRINALLLVAVLGALAAATVAGPASADSGLAICSRSFCAASTPIAAWTIPPTIISAAPRM